MAKESLQKYLRMTSEVTAIFDDLDKFRDFCRFELCDFNEANLYNRNSQIWNNFYYSTRPRKPRSEYNNNRGEYNRSGNNYNRNYQR